MVQSKIENLHRNARRAAGKRHDLGTAWPVNNTTGNWAEAAKSLRQVVSLNQGLHGCPVQECGLSMPQLSRALTGRRPLTTGEGREVMNIARRIAAILFLEPSLDTNYQAIKTKTYPWPLK
jgi:hypothetical protein